MAGTVSGGVIAFFLYLLSFMGTRAEHPPPIIYYYIMKKIVPEENISNSKTYVFMDTRVS